MGHSISIVSAIPWYAWIAIVAIAFGSLSGMLSAWLKHRERMAMIQQGMNPDSPGHVKNQVPEL